MGTDNDWQAWGERDPYFGVLSHERFRRELLTPQSLDEFFRMGRDEVGATLADCRRHLGAVSLQRTLDFGCGVGRLLIPLAELAELCVGVDVSDAMREEAARNCAHYSRANVRLVKSLDEVAPEATFTFIHSYIVLQHIESQRGLGIIAALLGRLAPGGCAALHVTYGRSKYRNSMGVQPPGQRLIRQLRRRLSRLTRRFRHRDPPMQMNRYDLNRVLFLAQQRGIGSGGFRFTDHAGHLGVLLFLKRD